MLSAREDVIAVTHRRYGLHVFCNLKRTVPYLIAVLLSHQAIVYPDAGAEVPTFHGMVVATSAGSDVGKVGGIAEVVINLGEFRIGGGIEAPRQIHNASSRRCEAHAKVRQLFIPGSGHAHPLGTIFRLEKEVNVETCTPNRTLTNLAKSA